MQGTGSGGVRRPPLGPPAVPYPPPKAADPGRPPALLAIGILACRLSGSVVPFDQGTLDALYPNRLSYLVKVRAGVDALLRQGLLLPEDAAAVMSDAARSSAGR